MNARYTLIQNLRGALGETAACIAALLASSRPQAVPVTAGATRTPAVRPVVLARRFALVATLAAAGSLAGTANANVRPDAIVPGDLWADGRLVDVQVRVDGDAAPLYLSPRGDRRHYFEAFAGRNYSLVLRNNTAKRIGVLLTVDGLNVVNGEITKLSPNEPMYVLDAWESATIQGWRTSMNDVRRFVFVDEKRSYASRTGQANEDMGWIRVLAFREMQTIGWFEKDKIRRQDRDERAPLPWFDSLGDRAKNEPESAAPRAGAEAPAPTVQRMDGNGAEKQMASRESSKDAGGSFPGTGWGDHRTDRVHYVDFKPERSAVDQLVFRYEYARGLISLGIYPERDRLRDRDRGGLVGFARPPRW